MSKKPTAQKPPLDLGGETLGERLARMRKQSGFTQIEFAKKVGITQVLVSAQETDRACFAVEMAVRFAMTLGIGLDELLHRQAKKTAEKRPNRKDLRRLELTERLPRRKRDALLMTIDTFLESASS